MIKAPKVMAPSSLVVSLLCEETTFIFHVIIFELPLLLVVLTFIVFIPSLGQEVVKLSKLLF